MKRVGLNITGLEIIDMKFLISESIELSLTPTTLPSSITPQKISPPKRLAKEHTVSYASLSRPLPALLNSTDIFSPQAINVFASSYFILLV